jgi:hypothetical protein
MPSYEGGFLRGPLLWGRYLIAPRGKVRLHRRFAGGASRPTARLASPTSDLAIQRFERSTGDSGREIKENPGKMGIFVLQASVCKVQKAATITRIFGKSLANAADIPVFERL